MKTLRRSITNRTIGGVCGGIAEYFSLDPVLIRLLFVVLVIFGGAGLIIYVLAWIVMPERSLTDSIQDAEITNSNEKTDESMKKEFENVKEELRQSFQTVEKEIGQIEKEIDKEIKKHKHSSSSWFGIFLIFLGAIFLFRMFGWLNFSWCGIWNYWPILLILVGVSCIPMKKWLKNGLMLLSLIALLFAMMCNSHSGRCFTHHSDCSISVSRSGNVSGNRVTVETSRKGDYASLEINAGACKLNLFKTTEHLSQIWLNGESVSFVGLTDESKQLEKFNVDLGKKRTNACVDLAINEDLIWELELNVGAASVNLDLSAFKMKEIEINSGAANIDLMVGQLFPETEIEISTGASNIKVRIPKNADCRVITESFLMSRRMDGFVKSGNSYRTENFGSASQTITIKLDGAVGSFEIIRY